MPVCILAFISISIIIIAGGMFSMAVPIPLQSGSCYDDKKYYTSTTILNHDILYTPDSNISINNKNNITFQGYVILEYHILTSCHYVCKMKITSNSKNKQFLFDHFQKYFRIGGVIHMLCNSLGCEWKNTHCDTFEYHDEL